MTETPEQKKVRFLIFTPGDTKIHGLDKAIRVLGNRAWAEVVCTTDLEEVCKKVFAREFEALVLLRPNEADTQSIEQVLMQWSCANPEEVPVLLNVDWPTSREAHFWRPLTKNVRLYCGFHDMESRFFLFGEFVRSQVK